MSEAYWCGVTGMMKWSAFRCKVDYHNLQMIKSGSVRTVSHLSTASRVRPDQKYIESNTLGSVATAVVKTVLVLWFWKAWVAANVLTHLPRCASTMTPWRRPPAWQLSVSHVGGCGTTSPASADVVLSLASAHVHVIGLQLIRYLV